MSGTGVALVFAFGLANLACAFVGGRFAPAHLAAGVSLVAATLLIPIDL